MAGTQRLDLGRDVATRLAAAEGAEAAFLAGSFVVGLGSGSSDVDVYLVGSGWRPSRRQLLTDGVRVDIQMLATERLADVVDRVVVDFPAPAYGRVTEADLILAVRLFTGEVVADSGTLAALKARLAAHPLPLRRMVINNWARTAYSAVEDVAGLRASDDRLDLDAATTAGRRALLAAGKALAASGGDLYFGDKWVWHQLARSTPGSFPLATYRRLMHDGTAEPDGLAELVAFVQACLAAAMTLGWWNVPLEHWPSWTGGRGPLRRTADFLPCSSDTATLLVGPRARMFRVPAGALLVWALCGGTFTDEVVDRLSALRPLAAPWNGVDGQRCRAVLRELADASLIAGVRR